MKNIFGTTEELKLKDENGVLRYEYIGFAQSTYDSNGYQLTSEYSNGNWHKYTYDSNRNLLTYKNSDGDWSKYTYDSNRNLLTYKNSNGYWSKSTYDSKGNELTYENSDGAMKGFDIPEYTMEELTKEVRTQF
jgi:YD repeat-containing protein